MASKRRDGTGMRGRNGRTGRPVRPALISSEYLVRVIINGSPVEMRVRATSEASARLKAAEKFSERYNIEILPFWLGVTRVL